MLVVMIVLLSLVRSAAVWGIDYVSISKTQMAQKKVYILMRSPCFRGLIACEVPLLERCLHVKGERAPLHVQ